MHLRHKPQRHSRRRKGWLSLTQTCKQIRKEFAPLGSFLIPLLQVELYAKHFLARVTTTVDLFIDVRHQAYEKERLVGIVSSLCSIISQGMTKVHIQGDGCIFDLKVSCWKSWKRSQAMRLFFPLVRMPANKPQLAFTWEDENSSFL